MDEQLGRTHTWSITSGTATADRLGIKVNNATGENYIVGGSICNEEILRLAGEVQERTAERDRWTEAANVGAAKRIAWLEGELAAARKAWTAENALLRRERALLIELEKTRTRILASIFNSGGGCSADDVRQVGELLMAVEAIHLEASGGVQRPAGVGCACVLCRPEGLVEREAGAAQDAAMEVFERSLIKHLPAWPNCPACGYPGHGETDRQKKYMGIYRPGEPCDKCGHTGAPGKIREIRAGDVEPSE